MGEDGNSNDIVSKKALEIQKLLDSFDEHDMIKALTHSHQILDDYRRKSSIAGKSDSITWEYESVQSDTSNLEKLFKDRAYDKNEDRSTFVKVYTNVIKKDTKNPERSE